MSFLLQPVRNCFSSAAAGGFRTLLTDRSKLVMTVGGATALAAGVYTTRYADLFIAFTFQFLCYYALK